MAKAVKDKIHAQGIDIQIYTNDFKLICIALKM